MKAVEQYKKKIYFKIVELIKSQDDLDVRFTFSFLTFIITNMSISNL